MKKIDAPHSVLPYNLDCAIKLNFADMTQNNSSMSSMNTKQPAPVSNEAGSWMYYDEAAVATGKSEKTLKRYTKKGELKWRRVGKQINSPIQVWITQGFIASVSTAKEMSQEDPDIFDAESEDVDFSPKQGIDESTKDIQSSNSEDPPLSDSSQQALFGATMEKMLGTLVKEFRAQIEQQALEMSSLRNELEVSKAELRLLPDLEKIAREKEEAAKLKEFESEALRKQVTALEESKREAEQASEAAKAALQIDVEALKKELEQLKKPWWKKMFEAPPAEP